MPYPSSLTKRGMGAPNLIVTRGFLAGDHINVTADSHHVIFDNAAAWYPLDVLTAVNPSGDEIEVWDYDRNRLIINGRDYDDFYDGAGALLGGSAAATVTALQALFDSP